MNQVANIQHIDTHVFANANSFEAAQRMATALSKSTLVPTEYQNNMPNALIALEVASRIGASPLMVMQNLYIVHGRPSWSSKFVISAINTCGRFKPLRFHLTGKEGSDERTCIAWTLEKRVDFPASVFALIEEYAQQGKQIALFDAAKKMGVPLLEGPPASIDLAKKEGWYNKSGSKWKTIPELMLHYRSASFFGGLYAPDVLMGMYTAEEVEDFTGPNNARNVTPPTVKNSDVAERFMEHSALETETQPIAVVASTITQEAPPQQLNLIDIIAAKKEPMKGAMPKISPITLWLPEGMMFYPEEMSAVKIVEIYDDLFPGDRSEFREKNAQTLPQIAAIEHQKGNNEIAVKIEEIIK